MATIDAQGCRSQCNAFPPNCFNPQALELALLDPSAGESISAGMSAARDAEELGEARWHTCTQLVLAGGALALLPEHSAALLGHTQACPRCQLQPSEELCAVSPGGAAGGEAPPPSSDTRAEMLLDVILGTLLQPAEPPSLAHLLLGFDTSTPPTQWYYQELLPQHDYSCLSVVLRALQVRPGVHQSHSKNGCAIQAMTCLHKRSMPVAVGCCNLWLAVADATHQQSPHPVAVPCVVWGVCCRSPSCTCASPRCSPSACSCCTASPSRPSRVRPCSACCSPATRPTGSCCHSWVASWWSLLQEVSMLLLLPAWCR